MRWFSWLLVVLVCVAVAGGLGFYKYSEIQAAIARGQAFPEPAEAVEIYTVQEITRTPSLSVTGEIVAQRSATLQNELKGRIVEVGFAPGARVEEGQVLLQLDISQERAQLAEATADRQIARLALDRAQRLVRSGAGSVEARDQARAQFDAAGARVRALEALIDKKTLVAPFTALTSLHELQVGQYLDAGTQITDLIGLSDNAWIDFSLPQEHSSLPLGSEVMIAVSEGGGLRAATVIARDAAVNVRSRNLTLRAELTAPELLPGMLVRVSVPLGETSMAVVVPPTAVRRDAFGAAVYVLQDVDENGVTRTRARKRQVEIGTIGDDDQSGDWVIVTRGLEPGEAIAGIGAFKLADGTLVVPSEPNEDANNRIVGH